MSANRRGVLARCGRMALAVMPVVALSGATAGLLEVATSSSASAAAAAAEPSCVDPTLVQDGATAVYPMDDPSGPSVADVTTYSNTATASTSGVTYDTAPGPLTCSLGDGAMSFNGSSDVTTPIAGGASSVTGSALTVIAWAKATSWSNDNPRLVADSHTDSTNNGFQLMVNSGGGSGFFDVGTSTTSTTSGKANWSQSLATGVWYMYAGTYNGSTLNAYLNGESVGSGSATGAITAGTNSVAIGYDDAENGDFFEGQMADVAILPTALSSTQIAALYAAGSASVAPPCLGTALRADAAAAYYPLDESSGTVADDDSGNAENATIADPTSYDNPGPVCGPGYGALGFSGSTNVQAPAGVNAATTGSALTVMAWFDSSNLSNANSRVVANGHTDTAGTGFQMMFASGGASGFFDVGTASTSNGSAAWSQQLVANTWYFYVGTYNGATVTAYLNGVSVGSASASGAIKSVSNNVGIGYDPNYNGDYFAGQIADVAILPSALSAAQISGLYQSGSGQTQTAAFSLTSGESSGQTCGGADLMTASPPAGSYGAKVSVSGGGGGGGNTNSGSGGSGGNGGLVTGTLGLTHASGSVLYELGCGGGGGSECSGGCSTGGGGGAGGYAAGGAGGGAASVSGGDGASGGGGGGGATALCLGSTSCVTPVVVAGGGGGGGARWDCSGSDGPGTGGAGATSGTGTAGAGTAGTNSGDGSDGGGGGGGTASAGGGGGSGYNESGVSGADTPYASVGGPGAVGNSTSNQGSSASNKGTTGGGGGGGGYTGGGGGGGDSCTSGENASGGGGGGSSAINTAYGSSATFSTSGEVGAGSGGTAAPGYVSLVWLVAVVTVATPSNQSTTYGASPSLAVSAGDSDGLALSYSASGLPPGLSINPSSGVISGTVTGSGTFASTVTATDAQGASATSGTFTWSIPDIVTVSGPSGESGVTGTNVDITPGATDTNSGASVVWSDTGLPSGVGFASSTGAITGVPTTAGSYSVTLKATDSTGASGSATFTWSLSNTVSIANPGAQSAITGQPFSLQLSASDTSSTATVGSWTASGLPSPLTVDAASGVISGTPVAPSSSSVTVGVTDSSGYAGSATFELTISNVVSVTDPGAQRASVGDGIVPLQIVASDSQAGATLAYSAGGSLPGGLSIGSSSGSITGTPTLSGSYSVSITVSDGSGAEAETAFTWQVSDVVSVANPGSQASTTGSPIAPLADSASDTAPGASFAWSAAGLPPGLTISSSTGTISGSPTASGSYSVTVTATDDNDNSGSASFDWSVGNTVAVEDPGDQSDLSGSAIPALTISATDSQPAAALSFAATGLPSHLSIDPSTGAITGTPDSAGSFSVTVTATDGAGYSDSTTFSWTVTNLVEVEDPGGQTSEVGTASTPLQIIASDSSESATLSYSDGGTLPAGLSIDPASGMVQGTPTSLGTFEVTVTVTDNAGYTGSASFTWTIDQAPAFTSPDAVTFTAGQSGSVAVTASGTPAPALSVSGALPEGVTFADDGGGSGTLGGVPGTGTVGSYPITLIATSSAGTVTQDFTLDIAAAASSVVVTSSANPSGYAKAVTLSATVTGNDTLGAPGGTVSFSDTTSGDHVIAGCATAPLSASGSDTSTATCTYTPKATGGTGGTFTVVATSSGDSSYGGSASPAFSQVMLGSGHALLALSFSENPVPYSGSVTLTATLTFTSGSGTPGGTISFVDLTDNQTLCTVMAPTGVDHQATCAFSLSPDGTEGGVFSLEATYSGDSDYAFADDHQTLTELGDETASVAVTSSKPDKAATEGQTMVLYATVTGAEGTPSGSAVLSVDGSPITCVGLVSTSVHVNPEGEAVCKWQPEAAGTYAVTAGYSGDTTYAPLATSPTYDQLVDGMVATTAATPVLTSPPAPPGTAGEPITVTDTVTTSAGQVTTGDVAFSETISGTTSVACASEPLDATGTASCTFTPFAGSVGGAVKVTASYLGSGDDAPSAASPSLSVPVLGANLLSSFVVTSNADPAGAAKVVTLTATLSGSVGTPTGTATFTDDGTVISCNGGTTATKLSGSSGTATATCRYTPSGAGSDTIDASYGGDVYYAPASTPADFTQEVDGTGAVTSVAVTSAADPNAYDTSVTLTATVAAPSTPTGTVDFSATVAGQQADLCPTAVLSGTGGVATASCVYDPAVEGNAGQVATIRATYSGDATYAPKGSGVFTQTEDGTASLDAFTLTSNLNPSGSNKVVTFTATLTGETTPTGTVTFTDAGTPICTAAKVSASGVAICHLALSAAGDHLIAATYSGDATYAAATSPSDLDQQVS